MRFKLPKTPIFFKLIILGLLLLVWYLLSYFQIWNPLLFPDPVGTLKYALENQDFLISCIKSTLSLLIMALGISSGISLTLGSIASQSKKFRMILETLVSVLNPIPGISMLPFAMLWFGLGFKPILFVTIFGSLAVYILSIMNGLNTIPRILIEVGKIYGLKRWKLVKDIYLPAALPSIITGLKAAWGISWRSLVAAELVYGAMGKSGGLGWLITLNRYNLNPNGMAVGILVIILIGLLVEHLILGLFEKKTVKKWGMKND